MKAPEKEPLAGTRHRNAGEGGSAMNTRRAKNNYGVLDYNDDGDDLDDVPTKAYHNQLKLKAGDSNISMDSQASLYPYDMHTTYETIDDLRNCFTYEKPKRTTSKISNSLSKSVGNVRKLISRPRRLLSILLPILKSFELYNWRDFMWDMVVGISMATLQVPQGMAFATVAGIPLVYGLYIVWLPGLVYAIFGGCVEVSYGPYALLGLLLSDGLSKYGYMPCHGICSSHSAKGHEEERYLAACLGVSFLVGILFLVAALFNLGRAMSSLLPGPVISGFIQASAILIMVSQLPTFFQTPTPSSKAFITILESVLQNLDKVNWVSVIVGTTSIVVYRFLNFMNKKFKAKQMNLFIPEAIFVVACSTAVNYFFDLDGKYGLKQVGHIPIGLPHPRLPKFDSVENLLDMLQVAVSTGLISYIVTQSITTTVQKSKHVILGSIFQSLPGSASLSRAAIIEQLGPSSQLHSVAAFIFLTLFLLFFPPLLEFLPQSVLSSTILSVVYRFIKPKMCYAVWKTSKVEFAMLAVTFLITLFMGVLQGLMVGVSMSFLSLVIQTYSPTVLVLGKFPGTDVYRDVERYDVAKTVPGVVCMRFGSSLHFANIDFFVQVVRDSVSRRRRGGRARSYSMPTNQKNIEEGFPSEQRKLENLVTEFVAYTPPIEILLGPSSDGFVDSIAKSPMLMGTIGRGCYISMDKAVSYAKSSNFSHQSRPAQIKLGTLAVKNVERSPEAIYRNALDDGRNLI